VFATLEEAVGEEEMDDVLSQRPDESRSMLPRA